MKMKVTKVFKVIIIACLVITFTVSAAACKEPPPVVEEQKEEQTIPETPLVEEEQKEEIPPKTEEVQIEFNESMIKNRLVNADLEPWMKKGFQIDELEKKAVPLWYLPDWSEGEGQEIMVSGVIAGPLREDIGVTGKEELLLSVALQNPETKEFYVRDLSFGTDEVFQITQNRGGWPTVFLENYIFIKGWQDYTAKLENFEDVKACLKVGDQIVFSLLNQNDSSIAPPLEETKNSDEDKVIEEFMSLYFANNKAIYEAMKENGELPELILNPGMIVINKAEEN